MVKKGETVNEIFDLYNKKTNSSETIDDSKITVEVSDNNLVSIENNIITAKAEGELTVTYKYTHKNMNFEYEGKYYIYDEEFRGNIAPIIDKSYLNLTVNGDSKKLNAGVQPLGSAGLGMSDNFKYNWTIEDDSIASIADASVDEESVWESSIRVKPLKTGSTIIKCTIKSENGEKTIEKKISVTVTGTKDESKNEKDNNSSTNQKNNDSSVSPKEIPFAGLINGTLAIIVIVSIMCVVFYIKYKKIDK